MDLRRLDVELHLGNFPRSRQAEDVLVEFDGEHRAGLRGKDAFFLTRSPKQSRIDQKVKTLGQKGSSTKRANVVRRAEAALDTHPLVMGPTRPDFAPSQPNVKKKRRPKGAAANYPRFGRDIAGPSNKAPAQEPPSCSSPD